MRMAGLEPTLTDRKSDVLTATQHPHLEGMDSNHQRLAPKASVLPLNYLPDSNSYTQLKKLLSLKKRFDILKFR
jgi:hypothetical protein